MGGDRGREDPPIEEGARHKSSGVNVRAMVTVALGLVLFSAASVFMLKGLYRYLETRENANRTHPAVATPDARKLPPEPRLQESAIRDLQQMRGGEDQILSSYGWVDEKKGVVRIPIGRAIELLAQRGLPVRASHGLLNPAGAAGTGAEEGAGSKVH